MNGYDIFALILLLFFGLSGLLRGAVKSVIHTFALFIAVFIAFSLIPLYGPLAKRLLQPSWLGLGIGFLLITIIANVTLNVIAAWLSKALDSHKAISVVDHIVGLGFGLVRVFVVLGCIQLIISLFLAPDKQPAWLRRAAVYPVGVSSAHLIQHLIPRGVAIAGAVAPKLKNNWRRSVSDAPAPEEAK